MKRLGVIVAAAAVVALCGCSSSVTSTPSASPSSPLPSSTSPSPSSSVDVSGAAAAALTLFKKSPNNLNDPSAGYVWSGRPLAVSPVSAEVRARWLELNQKGYFSDQGRCGEDYVTGNQFGLLSEPKVASTQANPDGTVTVVIARTPKPPPPDLTVTMTYQNGKWLATDLASGTGPSASIFSAKPNC